jgi:hypothetical protein
LRVVLEPFGFYSIDRVFSIDVTRFLQLQGYRMETISGG